MERAVFIVYPNWKIPQQLVDEKGHQISQGKLKEAPISVIIDSIVQFQLRTSSVGALQVYAVQSHLTAGSSV